MAAVLAGMTVLQLAQLAAAVGAAGVSFWTIHEDLKTAGLSDHDPIPQQMLHAVAAALRDLADKLEPP
jgi:3-deoxy-D-arabino-heptulosonate 7-phosphate (DAHP) synthase